MNEQELEATIQSLRRRLSTVEQHLGIVPPTADKPLRGVDVYRGQGKIDWLQVAEAGLQFAIIKATEGVNFVDKRLPQNAKGASAAGLKIGYYHFARPDSGSDHRSDARAEAADFLEAIAALPDPDVLEFESGATAAVWLDLEKSATNLDEEEGLSWVLEWLGVVEKQWPAGLYTSDRWLDKEATPDEDSLKLLARRADGSRRPFWVARYGPNDGTPHPEFDPDDKVPEPWSTWDVWQYTSTGKVPGIGSRCDLNLGRLLVR